MGAVDTTYTFTATDTITSTKMNNIIDQTTMTDDAVFVGGTVEVSGGKLRVRSGSITSNEIANLNVTTAKIADSNVTTAKIADSNVTTAKIANANVTQAKLATNVAGNGPVVIAYASVTQTLGGVSGFQKVFFDTTTTDTNNNFSNSRFTATVAGYYLFIGSAYMINTAGLTGALVELRSGSGSPPPRVICSNYYAPQNGQYAIPVATGIRYMAVGEWMEMWVSWTAANTSGYMSAGSDVTHFHASLIRSA